MTTVQILAVVGLVLGLVIFLLVVKLLNDTLTPLRAIRDDVVLALKAPMLEHGVRGTEQTATTRRLAESVPPLALAYLAKLGAGAPPPQAAPPPQPAAAQPVAAPAGAHPDSSWQPPAWHRYRK
jgi:hypothetical protein